MEQQQPKKPPFRTVLRQFLLAFLFSGVAFSVLVYSVLKLQAHQQLAALKVLAIATACGAWVPKAHMVLIHKKKMRH